MRRFCKLANGKAVDQLPPLNVAEFARFGKLKMQLPTPYPHNVKEARFT